MLKKNKKFSNEKGAMALSSVLALSMILLALGLAMAFSGFIQSDITYNQDKAAIAFYIAEAGAKDAMQKVVRNKNYDNTGYCLVMDNGRADIVVSRSGDQTEINSTGISGVSDCNALGTNTKKVRVILNTNAEGDGNGKVVIVSWEEAGS